MKEFIEQLLKTKLVESAITITISIILYNIVKNIFVKGRKNKNLVSKLDSRQKTYLRLFNNILKYAFIIITVLIVLQINGVNVTSMLTGVGIVGVVFGFALQDALKDIIMGTNIITDNFFSIGDVIKYKDTEGKVVSFGLKTTKIQDIYTNNILTITNRNIDQIEKVSNYIYLNIPTPYEVKIGKVETLIPKIVSEIEKIEHVEKCNYLGLDDFEESCVVYKLAVSTSKPEYKLAVRRAALRIIRLNLDENDIDIPYNQIDIHTK